jgi:hypothetical protein
MSYHKHPSSFPNMSLVTTPTVNPDRCCHDFMLCLWYMPCQVLPLLLELRFVLPEQLLDFFLFIYKFFLFMTDVIGREECSTAHGIDACKIDEAGKITHNF